MVEGARRGAVGASGKQEVRKEALLGGVGSVEGRGVRVLQLGCSNSSAEG